MKCPNCGSNRITHASLNRGQETLHSCSACGHTWKNRNRQLGEGVEESKTAQAAPGRSGAARPAVVAAHNNPIIEEARRRAGMAARKE